MSPLDFYLFLYNFAQFLGWSAILLRMGIHYAEGKSEKDVWPAIGDLLFYFQWAAVLEVFHALVGLVKSSVSTTVVQVASRVLLTMIATYVPDAQKTWFLTLMVGSWAITEVVRYLFYSLNIVQATPSILVWLRYSLFLMLYPSGVIGEVGTLYSSLPYIHQTKLWSTEYEYINAYYALWVILFTYIPGLPYMMSHMIRQRKKSLAGTETAKHKKRQ